jgi:hypothetical protein
MTTILSATSVPAFYTFNFKNNEDVAFDRNKIGTRAEIVEVGIPCFDNICDAFETRLIECDVGGLPTIAYLDTGCYTNGDDMAAELTAKTPMTWTFNSITKRMVVTHAANFTLMPGRLLRMVLGFNDYPYALPVASLTANDSLNLFPFSHYIIKSPNLPQRTYLQQARTCVVAINISTFDFVTTTRTVFTKDSYRAGTLTFSDNFFPASFSLWVLFLDGDFKMAPLKDNLKVNMSLKLT